MEISIHSSSFSSAFYQAQSAYAVDPNLIYEDSEFFRKNLNQYKLQPSTKAYISQITELIRENKDQDPSIAYVMSMFQLLIQLDNEDPGFLSGSKSDMFGTASATQSLTGLIDSSFNARLRKLGLTASPDTKGLSTFKKDLVISLKKMLVDGIGSLDELIDILSIVRMLGESIPRGLKNQIAKDVKIFKATANHETTDARTLLMISKVIKDIEKELNINILSVNDEVNQEKSENSVHGIDEANEANADFHQSAGQGQQDLNRLALDQRENRRINEALANHKHPQVQNFYGIKPANDKTITFTETNTTINQINDSTRVSKVQEAHDIHRDFAKENKEHSPSHLGTTTNISNENTLLGNIEEDIEIHEHDMETDADHKLLGLDKLLERNAQAYTSSVIAMFAVSLEKQLDNLLENADAINPLFSQ